MVFLFFVYEQMWVNWIITSWNQQHLCMCVRVASAFAYFSVVEVVEASPPGHRFHPSADDKRSWLSAAAVSSERRDNHFILFNVFHSVGLMNSPYTKHAFPWKCQTTSATRDIPIKTTPKLQQPTQLWHSNTTKAQICVFYMTKLLLLILCFTFWCILL